IYAHLGDVQALNFDFTADAEAPDGLADPEEDHRVDEHHRDADTGSEELTHELLGVAVHQAGHADLGEAGVGVEPAGPLLAGHVLDIGVVADALAHLGDPVGAVPAGAVGTVGEDAQRDDAPGAVDAVD